MGTLIGKMLSGVAVLAFAVHAAAVSAGTVNADPDKPTAVEEYLMAKGNQIVQAFPAASGMKGIVVDNGTEKRLFYVTPDGQSLVAGMMFDVQGTNLTTVDLGRTNVPNLAQAPDEKLSAAQRSALWEKVSKLNWFSEGTSSRIIYVFFDPSCAYCHELWGMLRTPVSAGEVQVRWIPVSLLRVSSSELSASIYARSAKGEQLSVIMAEMANRQLQTAPVSEEVKQRLADNLAVFREAGFRRIPMILYRDGGQVRVYEGSPLPKDLAIMLEKE
ncbi:thiol:disulfide interchange protein DsbG [Pseudomonas sp. WS 5532]|uniref:thiol:disulfide interchange protein DsbG n=1 Tax=Pseudomonas sp. WS 5532 TaxID=2717495 RepID=UPI0021CD0A41|nr:thiol:disulfide interchange protein DsbG [Pseudomonas sp. WS 5532]